jgi:hypothetical protein
MPPKKNSTSPRDRVNICILGGRQIIQFGDITSRKVKMLKCNYIKLFHLTKGLYAFNSINLRA